MSAQTMGERAAWEKQSRRQFGWTAAFSMGIQLYAAATGIVMVRARSAAWWVTALSVLPALMMYLPLWRLSRDSGREEWTGRMRNRLGKWGAGAFFLMLGFFLLMDAAVAMKLLSMLVRQYVISGGVEVLISLCTAGVLGWAAALYGAQSLSRLTWLMRYFLLLILLVGIAAVVPSGGNGCLYPVMGKSAGETLAAFPAAAGAYAGAAALPLLRKAGDREKPMRFWEGVCPMTIAAGLAGCLMLLNQLTISPLMISDSIFWARRLLLGAESIENGYILQVLFLLGLMSALMISFSFSLTTASRCLKFVLNPEREGGVMLLCLFALAVFALGTGENFTRGLWTAMEARFWMYLALFYAAWMLGGIRRLIKTRRGGKGA